MSIFACAALMLTSVAFTSCNNENEPQKKAETVTANINIALPANATGGVQRMPGATVQVTNGVEDFQGIGNICLIPFGLSKNATVEGTDTKLGDKIAGITDIAKTQELAAVSKAKIYEGKSIPTGTSAFLFYAQSNTSTGTNFDKGVLTYVEANTTAGTTKFELRPIQPNAITSEAAYTKLLAYVQSVADATDGTKAWKNYTVAAGDNQGMVELFDIYKTTKNLNSFNIQRMMNDLLSTMSLTQNTLADNMRAAIKNTAYVTYDEGTKTVTLKSDDNLNNFPGYLSLPEGSVSIIYDADAGTFGSSADKEFVNSNGGAMNMAPTNLYVYPASLWYYANTTINTDDQSRKTELEDATHEWDWVLNAYENKNAAVTSKTRSIALVNPVNYAVGRFDVKVKLDGAILEDANVPTATNIDCNGKLQLTAVLVGGQQNVGFDFTPASYPATSPVYTIYDNAMTKTINATTTFGDANSTLVLETPANGTTGADIMIAIELLNNTGKDFVGADGVIPAGGKFYLVGKLTAANATTTPKQVFIKDYTTTAQLNIVDLKHAYNGIPDLRTPSLEIGLSIDLSWTAGTTYNIDL